MMPIAARRLTDHGRERQQQLLDAAAVLFSERGYAATRIADICAAAGAAKGLFYWYFPTKLDLFVELVTSMRRRLDRAQLEAMDPDATPLTRLRQGAVASVRFINANTPYFSFMQTEQHDPVLTNAIEAGRNRYLNDTIALIEEARLAGEIGEIDPCLAAHGVIGAVTWFTDAWRRRDLDQPAEVLAEFVGDWVVAGLQTAPAQVG
jgi:AcrR family transcriptional regulator